MKRLNKNTAQTVTLLVGVLTAFLLIFGTFSQAVNTLVVESLGGWVTEPSSVEQIRILSSNFIEIVQGLGL